MAERVERRLTTILAADVAEYSRLMRADEDGTLSRFTACREVVDGLIVRHRGRIANTAGDSVLAEFPSVADGLSCGLAIQDAVREKNAGLPADCRMLFRIGVHLGDVMIRDGDLFGDAANIAARLQALAEPGGICVSAGVREHAGSRVPAAFTDAGAQQVKNIAEPVRVFRVAPSGESTKRGERLRRPSRSRPPRSISMFAAESPGIARKTTLIRLKDCARPAGRTDLFRRRSNWR
jgi:adenylate cyclase